jgi:pimeloyl-ACP methyl ester carboxylesterase
MNFVVVHDFFDTCDATAIMLKPIIQRHDGCQIICFNYPGQANTTWPRPPAAEKQRGAKEPILNNEFIADKLNEMLQYAEENGDILLTNPFHIVGIGNGACIAAAFLERWGRNEIYSKSITSFVSINGFLYPDPQLSAILHSGFSSIVICNLDNSVGLIFVLYLSYLYVQPFKSLNLLLTEGLIFQFLTGAVTYFLKIT